MQFLHSTRPSAEEHTALLADLGALPIEGQAWPTWVKVLVWIVVVVIGIQFVRVAMGYEEEMVSPWMAGSIIIIFGALLLIARVMAISTTRITEEGIEQTWITKRAISWNDIQFAKFVPMIATKRLICFTGRSRPVVFQSGTPELHKAFAQIAVVYRKR